MEPCNIDTRMGSWRIKVANIAPDEIRQNIFSTGSDLCVNGVAAAAITMPGDEGEYYILINKIRRVIMAK